MRCKKIEQTGNLKMLANHLCLKLYFNVQMAARLAQDQQVRITNNFGLAEDLGTWLWQLVMESVITKDNI